jgi:hypothetical protein
MSINVKCCKINITIVQNGPNLSYNIPGIKPIPSPRFNRDDWSSTETGTI